MSGYELTLEATREVSRVRHQLALGLSFVDSVSAQAVIGSLLCSLEQIGSTDFSVLFQPHRRDRMALRFEGAIKKQMDKLIKAGLPAAWTLRAFGTLNPAAAQYQAQLDPHVYVPRRLNMDLVLAAGVPASSTANMRTPWLWPGPAYPFAATSTLVRGRVMRGASLSSAVPLPWARLFATVPSTETVFSQAQIVGCGHGDGRGEFVLALDAKASTGAALKNPVPVRLWAFVPPAGPNLHPDDPLAQLPVEVCGTAVDSSVLRGLAVPPGYSVQQSRNLALRLGETLSGSSAEFLFAP